MMQEADSKYVVEAILIVPSDYFKVFIDMLCQYMTQKMAKLAVNIMIGCFDVDE